MRVCLQPGTWAYLAEGRFWRRSKGHRVRELELLPMPGSPGMEVVGYAITVCGRRLEYPRLAEELDDLAPCEKCEAKA